MLGGGNVGLREAASFPILARGGGVGDDSLPPGRSFWLSAAERLEAFPTPWTFEKTVEVLGPEAVSVPSGSFSASAYLNLSYK